MKRLVFIAICAALVGACATQAIYGPAASARASGFTDQRIEADRFRVNFRGAGPSALIGDYALLRAAELTLAQGYDWFRVVNRTEDAEGARTGPRMTVGLGGGDYGRRGGVGVGVSTGMNLGPGATRTVSLEIKMGRGPTPSDRDIYDARAVSSSIRARL